MVQFLLSTGNMPFTVALVVMVALALLEVAGLIFGASVSDALETVAGGDTDGLSSPVPEGSESGFSSLLSWLRFREVPVLVLLIVFLASFGLTGLVVQNVASSITGSMLPALLASVPAFFAALPCMRFFGGVIAKIIPKDETEAVSTQSFIGRTATIVLGRATQGKAAEAKLKDEHGQTHFVMLEPDLPDQTFEQGQSVLLVRQQGPMFYAIAISNEQFGEA
jgi:hypothetical protein